MEHEDLIVSMKGIQKSFGGVHALTDGELTLRKGEVLGLIGENGAGKSTLMKILSGVYQADAGVMAVSLVACGNSESTPAADSTTETAKPATAENSDTFDVEMVGNSFSIEYCNINVDGARDAVDDLAKKGVTVNLTYNASADSSQVDEQINILNQALAKQPNAILIAACDSGALDEQMITARDGL